ncbi:MAG: hypothetical protein U1E34_12755 [Amaricoccus sp.]
MSGARLRRLIGERRVALSFVPFLAYVLVDRLLGTFAGLMAGAGLAGLLLALDAGRPGVEPKALDVGTVGLFAGLAVHTLLTGAGPATPGVRLFVDAGLFLIVLGSLLVGRPFTEQYAREQVPRDYWDRPGFRSANYVVTLVWTGAVAVVVLVDLLAVRWLGFSDAWGDGLTFAALLAAARFTAIYRRRKLEAAGLV